MKPQRTQIDTVKHKQKPSVCIRVNPWLKFSFCFPLFVFFMLSYAISSIPFASLVSAAQIDSFDSATGDWSTTDGTNFAISNEGTIVNEGTGSAKIVSTATQGDNEYVYRSFGSTQDFSSDDEIRVDVRSSLTGNILKWHIWESGMSGTTSFSQSIPASIGFTSTYRLLLPAGTISTSGNQCRVRAVGATGNSVYQGWTIGERSGSTQNCVAGTWKPITWNDNGGSGQSTGTIASGSTRWSDWIDYDIDETKNYFVTFYMSSNIRYTSSAGGGRGYYWSGSNLSGTQDWGTSGSWGSGWFAACDTLQVRTVPEKTVNISSADTWEIATWDLTGETDSEIDAIDRMSFQAMSASAATMYLDDCTTGVGTPTGVSATKGIFLNRVTVAWNATSGATAYEIWRNTVDVSGSATRLADAYEGGTSYDDTTVDADTTYYYWIKAENDTETSGFSDSDYGYSKAGIQVSLKPGTRFKKGVLVHFKK